MEEILWLKGGFFLGAVIGGTAAAVAALLLAKSGKELRDDLSNQTDDLKQSARLHRLCCSKGTELTEIAKQKPAFYQIKPLIWQVLSKKTKDSLDKAQGVSGDMLDNFKTNR